MWPFFLLLSLGASPPRLHVEDASSCAPTSGLLAALTVRMPQLTVAEPGAPRAEEDRVLRLGTDARLTIERPSGELELERALTGSCDVLAELAAAVVERHFAKVTWQGLGPTTTPLPAVELEPPLPDKKSPLHLRVLVGFGGGSDGAAPLSRLGLEVSFGTDLFQAGLLAGTSFEQRATVTVQGRDRGEVRSRLDDVLGVGSLCVNPWRFRGCAGVAAGVLVLSGEAKGSLSDLEFGAVPALAFGGTVLLAVDLTERFFLAVRGTGVAPLNPPGLVVEGADQQRVVRFQAIGSLGLGVTIF